MLSAPVGFFLRRVDSFCDTTPTISSSCAAYNCTHAGPHCSADRSANRCSGDTATGRTRTCSEGMSARLSS